LIKDGKMPVDQLKGGEITVLLDNSRNLAVVGNMPYLYVKLRRFTYSDDGTVKKEPYSVKVCK
jgi:hypothetical protein